MILPGLTTGVTDAANWLGAVAAMGPYELAVLFSVEQPLHSFICGSMPEKRGSISGTPSSVQQKPSQASERPRKSRISQSQTREVRTHLQRLRARDHPVQGSSHRSIVQYCELGESHSREGGSRVFIADEGAKKGGIACN